MFGIARSSGSWVETTVGKEEACGDIYLYMWKSFESTSDVDLQIT